MNTSMKQIMTQIIILFLVMITMISSGSTASAATVVSIGDLTCDDGGTVTAEIMLSDVQNYGTGAINITYNPSVVHVTGVAGNSNSTVIAHNADNAAGITSIAAWNTGGVSGDVVFASVTFEAVGTGSTPLGIDVVKMRDTSMTTPIPVTVDNGSITIGGTEPQLPFLINGYVNDSNGDPCNDPAVRTTNMNTSVSRDAKNSSASNYYRLTLSVPGDVTSGDVLHFNVTDGTSTNTTDHTITTDEVNAGGLFDFDLTLESTGDPAPYLVTYTISNTTISPNGDGVEDDTEIDVEFSESVSAAIKIENASGVVRIVYTSPSVTDPNPKTWDGTDGSSDLVADGTYHVNITMDDGVNPLVYDNTTSILVANISAAIISIGNASGNVTIPITIEDSTNVGAVDITLAYNASAVSVTNVTGGDFDVIITNLEYVHEGWVRIGAFQTNNLGLNGAIIAANVTFRSNSTNGTSSLNLSVTTFKDATNDTNPIPYIVQNGTYITALNGDVNGDGVVDIADAMYLAKHVLGKSGFEETLVGAADVNGDGVVDIADAMYLAKHVLGKSGFEELR